MIRTLPFLMGALLLSLQSFAQISETFENGLTSLTANCWQLNNVKYSKKGDNPDYVIHGSGSLYSNPPVNNVNYRTLASPFLRVSNEISISFLYQLSSPLKDGATRIIELGLEDKNGHFLFLDHINLSASSSMAVQSYDGAKVVAPGVYRVVINMGGKLGDGSSRLVIDDLSIGAPYYYSQHCNRAPVAVDDSYTALRGNVYQGGSVLANDSEPDGEEMTALLVTSSAGGQVNFNADGSFSFVPHAGFKGDTTSFTYQVIDNGYLPATSNTATVTIKFEEAAPLVNLVDFGGNISKGKAQLYWEVGFNEMLDRFELEKSTDGISFNVVQTVAPSHKAGVETYNATDPATGSKLLYRLKLVGLNGSVEHSNVISLKGKEAAATLSIAGNPVTSTLVVNYTATEQGPVLVTLFSHAGLPVYTGQNRVYEGSNQFRIPEAGRLKPGTYVVSISNQKGETASSVFVKL